MLLFYLAVLLILVGLFVVFLATESVRIREKKGLRHALISKTGHIEQAPVSENIPPRNSLPDRVSKVASLAEENTDEPSEVLEKGNGDRSAVSDAEGDVVTELTAAADENKVIVKEEMLSGSTAEGGNDTAVNVPATLYEDRDSVVAFNGDAETIDVDRFNRLTRIASGSFVLSRDNIIFRADETMYRFDFSRIRKIEGEKNAFLVFPDTLDYPLLFIALVEEMLSDRVIRAFTEYSGRA